MPLIQEVKLHKNKPAQRFACELIFRKAGYAVLRYRSDSPGRIADMRIEAGSTTIAHYWEGRGYVLWRMFDAEARLIGTLFHICRDVRISEARVSYLDLIVDVWVSPDGTPRVLDEDELAESRQAGLITDEELKWIEARKQAILSDCARLIREAAASEKQKDT